MGSYRVGVAFVVLGVVLAGCGNSDQVASPTSSSVRSTTTSITTKATTTTVTTTTTTKPLTPEEAFDQQAIRDRWAKASDFHASSSAYSGPAGYVKHICAEFDGPEKVAGLSHGQRMEIERNSYKQLFDAGVPIFCPQHSDLLIDAQNGTVKRYYGNGSYFVPDKIPPGTYRTRGPVADCYWERTSADGDIIDNDFVTIAKELTVTVLPGDGAFTTRGCGQWAVVE